MTYLEKKKCVIKIDRYCFFKLSIEDCLVTIAICVNSRPDDGVIVTVFNYVCIFVEMFSSPFLFLASLICKIILNLSCN